MRLLDSENADLNIYASAATCLTDTPDVTNPCLCQAVIYLGDGTKNLDGTGGDFELTITVGSQTVQPEPQVITFSTDVRSMVVSQSFMVPPNQTVILKVKSPNAADTDVDVTAYLYDVSPAPGGSLVYGTVNDVNTVPTTTVFAAEDITEATADHFIGRVVVFVSGNLAAQAAPITDYELVSGEGKFTVKAMTEAPSDGDEFIIV